MLREKSQKVIEAVSPHLTNPKNTIREAAITALLNYSILILQKEDHDARIQILSALGSVANESDDQCKKRITATVNNLCFKNYEGKKVAEAMGLIKS